MLSPIDYEHARTQRPSQKPANAHHEGQAA
jgi:hypothetical protein